MPVGAVASPVAGWCCSWLARGRGHVVGWHCGLCRGGWHEDRSRAALQGPAGAAARRGGAGQRARWIEEAGLDAAWMGDASFRRLATWPDPMMWLLTVGAATSRIEVGTAIYQVPLRHPVDLAQQFLTMRALLGGSHIPRGRSRVHCRGLRRRRHGLREPVQDLPREHGHHQAADGRGDGGRRQPGPVAVRSPAGRASCSARGTAAPRWPGRRGTTTAGSAPPGARRSAPSSRGSSGTGTSAAPGRSWRPARST